MARFVSGLIDQGAPVEGSPGYNPLKDNKRLPVVVRMADEGDSGLVYSSWLKAHSAQNKNQHRGILYKAHGDTVRHLLENSITVIAAQDGQTDQVFAWMCGIRTKNGRLILHYCYTKQPFRSLGLARLLLDTFEYRPGEPVLCSHWSYMLKGLKDRYNLFYVQDLQRPDGVQKIESEEWTL